MTTQNMINKLIRHWLFIVIVALPTTVAGLYYALVASDMYVTESKFVIRSPNKAAISGLGQALQNIGFSSANPEIHAVHAYIASRDAMVALNKIVNLRSAYSNSNIDFLSKFNGLGLNDSDEALFKYYMKHIKVEFDSVTSISTLTVKGFNAKTSQQINRVLMHICDTQLGATNAMARSDMVKYSEQEVAAAKTRVREANNRFTAFRSTAQIINPEGQSQATLNQIMALQTKLLETQSEYSQLMQIAPLNPQVEVLQTRIAVLKNDIAKLQQSITSSSNSFNAKSADYNNLVLEKGFADKQLEVALTSYEAAKNDFARKQLYLQSVVQPSLPDKALLPRRFYRVLSVFALCMVSWLCCLMIITGIKEHTL